MFKITTEWRDGPVWPGPNVMETTTFMLINGALPENIKYGVSLILQTPPLHIEFIESSPEEAANGLSWKTVLLFDDETHANNLINYFNGRAKIEAAAVGYNINATLEVL